MGQEAAIGGGQVFWQNAGFAHNGHEVRIGKPTGQQVEVEMAGDAGSGTLADVDADV